MKTMNDIVLEMIEQHQGGEKFFDNLDANVKNKNFVELLLKEIPSFCIPITSGKFGLYVSSILSEKNIFNIVVNGSLRKGEPIISLEPFEDTIRNKHFAFIDDSFYKGRTRNVIEKELNKYGGCLFGTYVCYDGSKEKQDNVFSLYRYYDHFN